MKYRPVSPGQAWSSVQSAEMTWSERYAELYLLTSPMTNTIGCYPLVPRIAAAHMNVAVDELCNSLDRLERLGVARYRDGFVLVRTWFLHSTWESTFVGNVAKAVARELAEVPPTLLPHWVEACISARVPAGKLQPFLDGLEQPPFEGACKGLRQQNTTDTELKEEPNDNPTQSGATDLPPIVAPYSPLLSLTSARFDLNTKQQRELASALAERLESHRVGSSDAIKSMKAWLRTVASKIAAAAPDTLSLPRPLDQPERPDTRTAAQDALSAADASLLPAIREQILSSLAGQALSSNGKQELDQSLATRRLPSGLVGGLLKNALLKAQDHSFTDVANSSRSQSK